MCHVTFFSYTKHTNHGVGYEWNYQITHVDARASKNGTHLAKMLARGHADT